MAIEVVWKKQTLNLKEKKYTVKEHSVIAVKPMGKKETCGMIYLPKSWVGKKVICSLVDSEGSTND